MNWTKFEQVSVTSNKCMNVNVSVVLPPVSSYKTVHSQLCFSFLFSPLPAPRYGGAAAQTEP